MKSRRSTLFSFIIMMTMVLCVFTGCGTKAEIPEEYDYDDFSQFITLGNYKGLTYEKNDSEVNEADIRNYINQELEESAEVVQKKEGVVEKGSVVNIDYSGSMDGVAFEGGTAQDVELDIADNNFIDGFADAIVGHSVGENFDIDVTFPENYGKAELAGKPAVFNITVNYIVEKVLPDYNEEWVRQNTSYSSVEEYENSVKEQLESGKASNAQGNERMEVFNKIYESSEVIEYPEKEYQARLNKLTDTYRNYAESNDMEFSEYLENEMGITEDDFNTLAEEAAKETVKRELILHAIAKEENIDISADDYNDYLLGLLEDAGYTEASFAEEKGYSIQEYAENNDLFTSFMYTKVMDKVMEYSDLTE